MMRLREIFRSERLYVGYCLGICAGAAAAVDNLWVLGIFAVCFLAMSYWITD